jgi:hypothetical protein
VQGDEEESVVRKRYERNVQAPEVPDQGALIVLDSRLK